MHSMVTGGAGFIGSHLVDRLLSEGHIVTVYDNLSTGKKEFLASHNLHPHLKIVEADVLDKDALKKALEGVHRVYHLQANADVRGGISHTWIDLQQNTLGTYNLLECMRELGIRTIVFASSATVYGDPDIFPTPEHAHTCQTSLYGASKAACEDLIEAFCEYYSMQSFIFRFVSFVGPRYTHGVVFDFMKKLRNNPNELEILGDGKQKKSYLDVHDGIEAIRTAETNANEKVNIFNLGNLEYMNVVDLAHILLDELGMKNVSLSFTGGERGWIGDAPFVHLDVTKIRSLGWRPVFSIEEGIRRTARYLEAHPHLLDMR